MCEESCEVITREGEGERERERERVFESGFFRFLRSFGFGFI